MSMQKKTLIKYVFLYRHYNLLLMVYKYIVMHIVCIYIVYYCVRNEHCIVLSFKDLNDIRLADNSS